MNSSSPRSDLPSQPADPHMLKWDGHMADDVGCTYGHEPLAFLAANREELILAGNRGSFRLPRTSIRKIGRGKMYPWFFGAVRIHHTIANFPVDLQFKPLGTSPREVRAQLRSLGFPSA